MRNLVNAEEFSDVTFIVQDKPIYAHRAVLATRCDHFRAMFKSGMKESRSGEIVIPNTAHHTFLYLLEYLYTDTLTGGHTGGGKDGGEGDAKFDPQEDDPHDSIHPALHPASMESQVKATMGGGEG